MSRHLIGLRGERAAARSLEGRGWRVVHHRWRTREGEADLVAVKGHRGLVVEVKTSVGRAPACERLSQSQRERLWHIAELVVHHHDLLSAEVTLALVTLRRDHEALQWVTLDPY